MRLALAAEFQEVIRSYGSFLRRDVAVGHDHNLKAALNRIRLQDQILDGVGMADVTEACALLGLSPANASQSMKRCEGQVMRFKILRRAKYPLFQFDVDNRRVYPAFITILDAASKHRWSNFRLLNWMTRQHLDFDMAPADALADDQEAVLAAFLREVEPEIHG